MRARQMKGTQAKGTSACSARYLPESGSFIADYGVAPIPHKQPRNVPCECGSGKKAKKCCVFVGGEMSR